jgi:hypothetical protein
LTRTEAGTTVGLSPVSPPVTGSATKTYVFEARETITVQGRRHDTCRYRETVLGDRRELLLNVAHAFDHLFLLIFATAVAAIAADFGFAAGKT